MIKFLKTWMLPISMMGGVLFHEYMKYVSWISPVLIFCMLTITFTKLKFTELKLTGFHWLLLAVQFIGCWLVYYSLYFWNSVVAEGAFLCVFISTATAAPVITGMLGGSVSRLATYSLLCNMVLAFTAPLFLSWISIENNIDFMTSFTRICSQVVPMLIVPLILALLMRKLLPKVHRALSTHQTVSFWMWAVALFIVIGNAVSFIMKQPLSQLDEMIYLAIASLVVCCLQFYIGRKIGAKYGDKVAGAQGLGQKNTILALWLSLTYLNPIISIAPAAYIAWQNIINSTQLYIKSKHGKL